MPRINGVFSLVPSYFAVSGQKIRADQHNPPLEDIAKALTDSLPRSGAAPMTGNLPMGGNRITGLAPAADSRDAVRLDQVTLYSPWLASVGAINMEANRLVYSTGPATSAVTPITPFGRSIIDDADAAAARATLGVTIATKSEAEAGTNNSKYMTPLRTMEAIDASRIDDVYGVGRNLETIYRNQTDLVRTVFVSVNGNNSVDPTRFEAQVSTNQSTWMARAVNFTGNYANWFSISFPVAPWEYYRVRKVSGDNTVAFVEAWCESGA